MSRILLLVLSLFCTMVSQAADRGTHLSRNLRQENIPVEQATLLFSTWMKTNSDMSFVLVKDETDDLGFRHQIYSQLLNGVPIDATRLMVHSKDGRITYVNGFVMEADAARPKKMPASCKTPPSTGELVLVEADDGFRYAVKSFDKSTHEYVYTDVETGLVVKRLPTIYYAAEPKGQKNINSQSFYYGMQQIDVTQLDDGRLILADSIRRIYTYDAAYADTIPGKYDISDSADIKSYFDNELSVVQTRRTGFSMQEITSANISLSEKAKKEMKGRKLKLVVIDGDITIVTEKTFSVDDFPYVFIPMEHKSKNGNAYPLRQNDTDTTYIALVSADDDLKNFWTTAIDIMPICPTKDGGDAEVTASGLKGCLSATATMKGVGHYGVDVHWGMQRVYDFYKTKLNYNSYDNAGSPIISIINPISYGAKNKLLNITEPNAFASNKGQPYMAFGRGAPSDGTDELVDISILCHEFTHIITNKTAQLGSNGEPGALNEAFSDIFGTAANYYVANNFLSSRKGDIEYIYSIGSDSGKNSDYGVMRFYCDPWRCDSPKAIQGKYWVNPLVDEKDNGGIHYNNNVLNFWFYLLAEGYDPAGKYGLDTSVVDEQWAKSVSWKGIGIEKATEIAFRMLTRYMFPNANYRDAFSQSLVAVQDLGYDENSTEYQTVQKCWMAVTPSGYMKVDLTKVIDLKIAPLTTNKTYAENSRELIPYVGTELKVGDVDLNITVTMKNAAYWRDIYQSNLYKIELKCFLDFAFLDEYQEFDLSDFLMAFLKKCYNDKTVSDGYQETYNQKVAIRAGGPLSLTLDCPQLPLLVKQEYEVLEDARTYSDEDASNLSIGDKDIAFIFTTSSGYPLKVQPSKSGETVTFSLYLIGEDKSETKLKTETWDYTEEELLDNDFMKNSQNRRYEEYFSYKNDELLKSGIYKLKVSFSWEALKDAEFIFEVKNKDTSIGELIANPPVAKGRTYDLQGREVDTLHKGMYIRAGKKVIVR